MLDPELSAFVRSFSSLLASAKSLGGAQTPRMIDPLLVTCWSGAGPELVRLHFYGPPRIVKTARVLPSSLDIGSPSQGAPGGPQGPQGPPRDLQGPPRDPPRTLQGPIQGPQGPPRVPRDTSSDARGPPRDPQATPRDPSGTSQMLPGTLPDRPEVPPDHLQRSRGLF